MQQLAHVMTRYYKLATTTRPYQRNVKNQDIDLPETDFGFPQWLDQPQLPATTVQLHPMPWLISAYQHQTSSCISTTRPMPAILVERPTVHNYNYNSTIPANDVTHPSWRPHTTATYIYIHVCNSGNKIFTFVVSVISFSFIVFGCHLLTRIKLKFICGVDALIGSATQDLTYRTSWIYTYNPMNDQKTCTDILWSSLRTVCWS